MNVGIIGCGGIANIHMKVYKEIENINVIAVSDLDINKAKYFANRYGINNYYSDIIKLFELKDIGFIDICTPPSSHEQITCDAASFGHNVLVEKPMALSTLECDNMIQTSKKNNVKLSICHNQTAYRTIRHIKSEIESGLFDILSFHTIQRGNPGLYQDMTEWSRTNNEKGLIWEVGCHHAYLHQYILDNIIEIYAIGNKINYPVYDNFSVLLRTSKNNYGTITVSWIDKKHEIRYEAYSSEGETYKINRDSDRFIKDNAKVGLLSDIKKSFNNSYNRISLDKQTKEFGYYLGHYYLISEFINSVKHDTTPPVLPEDGKKVVDILECIEESLSKKSPIQLKG